MAPQTSPKIKEGDIQGLKHFKKMRALLGSLHQVGCDRDKSSNRSLHFDEYCVGVLLFLFNPTITSLRGIQQASQLKNVRKKLGLKRSSLGSLSESVNVFDPEPLKAIASQLAQQAPVQSGGDFSQVNHTLTAVDGSVFDTVARVAELAWVPLAGGGHKHAYRFHTQFEILRGVPNRIDVTAANPKGEDDERAVLGRTLEPDRCYVTDRGYAKFTLWNAIVDVGSSYICRVRDNSAFEGTEQLPLTEADLNEGVLSDQLVTMGQSGRVKSRPDHTLRMIVVQGTPHKSRTKYGGRKTGHPSDGMIRIVTNLVDIPAELISKIYRQRWLIELFFRMFKGLLGCSHLLSTKQNGIEIQAYLAIIACLLILIYTGKSPTKRTYEMICLYLQGWAELDELEEHIARLKNRDESKKA